MNFLNKLVNLIVYSSLWISVCAASMVLFTYDLLEAEVVFDDYMWFIFCATLLLYAVHRIIGMAKVSAFEEKGRFRVIRQYRSHIILYGVLAALGTLYFFWLLDLSVQLWLIVPVMLSMGYVLPVFGAGRRLRDFHMIKIFLIAAIWAVLTTSIPVEVITSIGAEVMDTWQSVLIFAERFLFILAITIPFDIRDIQVDRRTELRTLPAILGLERSRHIALLCLGISFLLNWWAFQSATYPGFQFLPHLAAYAITGALIVRSRPHEDDLYYSGMLDGTMVILVLSYWLLPF